MVLHGWFCCSQPSLSLSLSSSPFALFHLPPLSLSSFLQPILTSTPTVHLHTIATAFSTLAPAPPSFLFLPSITPPYYFIHFTHSIHSMMTVPPFSAARTGERPSPDQKLKYGSRFINLETERGGERRKPYFSASTIEACLDGKVISIKRVDNGSFVNPDNKNRYSRVGLSIVKGLLNWIFLLSQLPL